MIVSHLPFLNLLAGRLLAGKKTGRFEFRTSSVMSFVREDDGWRLEWQINPED